MNTGFKKINNPSVDELQVEAAEILQSSNLPDVIPTETSVLPTEYNRREDMVKTCLLEMDVAEKLSGYFAKTPLFGFKTQAAIFAAIMIGFDEGKRPTVALRDYCEIKGATLAKYGAAFLRDFVRFGGSFNIIRRDGQESRILFRFKGMEKEFSWTIEEAKNAGLLTKDNWRYYPADMLYWRCVARGVRSICPQATGGFYLPEEKGLSVDRDGVPLEDSLTATRPMRNLAPQQKIAKNQQPSAAKAKPKMTPEQIKQWCIDKAKIIKNAFVSATTEEELLSVLDKNSKTIQSIERGYKSAAARLRQIFSEMQVAIKAKAMDQALDDGSGFPTDDLDDAIIKDSEPEEEHYHSDNATVDSFSLDDMPF